MKILGLDVGKNRTGLCVYDGETRYMAAFDTGTFSNAYTQILETIKKYSPAVVVCGKPNHYYNIIANHNKYIGIACLACEEYDIPLIELNDMTVRATVFKGKGGLKKDQIMKLTGIHDPDMNDAFMLAKGAYILNIGE